MNVSNSSFCPPVMYLMGLMLLVTACSTEYKELSPDHPREECIERNLSVLTTTGVFYEIIDRKGLEVWGTHDFSNESFEEMKIPLWRRTGWFKNEPREGFIDSMEFTQSPGCTEGLFTYKEMYGRDWLKVVNMIELNQKMEGTDGLITRFTLEKYHRVFFFPGKTIYLLHSPEGDQYIALTRDVNRETDDSTIPDNWTVTEHVLTQQLMLELFGTLDVLRMDNEDSFQGPLAADFDIEPYTR